MESTAGFCPKCKKTRSGTPVVGKLTSKPAPPVHFDPSGTFTPADAFETISECLNDETIDHDVRAAMSTMFVEWS